MTSSTETLSRDDDPTAKSRGARASALVVVLECERPVAGSARHSLAGITRVEIARGPERTAIRDGGVLALTIPDARMSSPHARLTRRDNRWIAEDAGSKNGIYFDGNRHTKVTLDDACVIELGHTLVMLREDEPAIAPLDLDASDLDKLDPGMRTFVPELARRFSDLAAVSGTSAAILIRGETGTGKELAARAAHVASKRSGAFVPVNCGALPATLVESELFGYKRGAFSGADQDRPGIVRSADKGTLFLDEIGDLPAASQAALLRVLQERQVTPLGSTQTVPVDVQIVAATHHDLAARVAANQFRRDLYARLAAFTLELPPLHDRKSDLGMLIAALLPDPEVKMTCAAVRAMLDYDWPLNIRELASCLTVSVALARGEHVKLAHLPAPVRGDESSVPDVALSAEDQVHRDEVITLLRQHAGNISAVARATGKARAQIHRWLRRYRLDATSYRS